MMLKRAIIKLSTNCSLRKRDGKSDGKYNEKRSFCRKVALLLSASVLKYYIHKSAFYEDRALTFMNGYSYFSYDTFFFTIMLKLIRTSQRNAVVSKKFSFSTFVFKSYPNSRAECQNASTYFFI